MGNLSKSSLHMYIHESLHSVNGGLSPWIPHKKIYGDPQSHKDSQKESNKHKVVY